MPRTKAPAKAKPAPKKAGPRKMPPPMPRGETLVDFSKKSSWTLSNSIGKGGFGEIYSASKQGERGEYVVKIEPYENGPLFTELSFYRRVAKPNMIADWRTVHKLSYLSVPEFIAAGDHIFKGVRYRFLVMQRYGEDIEKKFTQNGRIFGLKTVCYLALRLLEALEFLHESEYVHADVKGSNLLTGWTQPHQVFLVDYGLAHRYCPEGVCQEYREDPRRAHDGTIEFTSIDAHKGANPSRRSDLEIMGYCLLQWAAGSLPWEGNLENKDYVAREKIKYKSNVAQLMKACFQTSSPPSCLRDFMKAVYKLEYTEKPDYSGLRKLFQNGLKGLKCKDDTKDLDWLTQKASGAHASPSRRGRPPVAKRVKEPSPEEDCDGEVSPKPVPRKQRVAKPKLPKDSEDDSDDTEVKPKPAARRRRVPASKPQPSKEPDGDSDGDTAKPKPVLGRRRQAVNYKDESDEEISPPISQRRRKLPQKKDSSDEHTVPRASRKRKSSPIKSGDSDDDLVVLKKVPKRAPAKKQSAKAAKLSRESSADIIPKAAYPTQLGYEKVTRNGRIKASGQSSPPKQYKRTKK